MKALRIVGSMNPANGGVVEAINQSAASFSAGTMEVLCFDSPDSYWIKESKYKIYALNKGKTAYGFNWAYLSWLWNNAKNYDVVIIDGIWQFLTWGGYVLKCLNVRYCVFTHGMLDPYFNKNKLKYIKKLPFWFMFERNVIAMSDAVLFTCREESFLAQNSFPFLQCTPKIARLGIEGNDKDKKFLVDLFLSKFKTLENKKFAIFLSRLNRKKGIDLLVDALSQIKALPDDFVLAIAGPDSDGLKARLVDQIEKLNLSNRVVWLGMLSGDIKWGAYHAAEVFVLPSHQENFGIVVAEALSTATPVLITNKVNIWREIETAGAGFVGNDNIEGVRALLTNWFGLPDPEKAKMILNAKACYMEHFSIDTAASDLESALLSISGK